MNRGSGEFEVRRERLLPFLAALILFHIVNNSIWLCTNVTHMGWDRMGHLIATLVYGRAG